MGLLGYALSGKLLFLGGVVLFSFLCLIFLSGKIYHRGYWLGGPGNWLTAFRLALMLFFLGRIPFASNWELAGTGLLSIVLDGADGRLARRYGTESALGAFFDRETDAFSVLCLSLGLYLRGETGWWILLLGLVRYAYSFIDYFLTRPQQAPLRTPLGRFAAGTVMTGLPLAFVLPEAATRWGLPALGLLLALSFLSSFFTQLKQWKEFKSRPHDGSAPEE